MKVPYISFILWTRNDDYVPDQLRRIQMGLDVLMDQLERHKLEAEIILVAWNPPPERSPLEEALQFSAHSNMVTIRIITVDPPYHRRYEYWEKKPVHGAAAFNVGVRRSRGRFVLAKVQDSFYSEPLMKFLSEKRLQTQCFYRCDRYVVDPVVLEKESLGTEPFLEACEQNIRDDLFDGADNSYPELPSLRVGSVGDFLLMSREFWYAVRGWYETPDVFCLDVDILAMFAAHASGACQAVLSQGCRVYKIAHPSMYGRRTRMSSWSSWPFIMRTWKWTEKIIGGKSANRIRILVNQPKRRVGNVDGVKVDSWARTVLPVALKWAKGITPFYLNGENWGLATAHLKENLVCRAGWDPWDLGHRKHSSDFEL